MSALTVIKIGGGVVVAQDALWQVVRARAGGTVLVHGGGPQATAMARRLGHDPVIVQGRRVTSDLDLDIVRWTMRGEINLSLVAGARRHGLPAVGISGADGATLQVTRRPPWEIDGQTVDFGWVGDVQGVDPSLLQTLISSGYLPVVAPIGIDAEGQVYNVNADTVSVAIAGALAATELLLVTETGGLLDDAGKPVERCDRTLFQAGLDQGWIQGGMRVKVQLALEALEAGVSRVRIVGPGLTGGTVVQT
ncbi:MAG: acetylglutamate kinase [Rhodothermales bacterium]|nr:acetylglutamate kinase [Rhodothermales bacterium]